ncbi:ABC transporter permease [Pararhizobium haloflavum]|uniref:ABC transporter permease n=1 Tax=Pararhizobium haloflavum TaxID=2037914 RepID=UPI000C1998BB|nr:ABC transporter permease [Pararhizobium haloflavum]
MQAMLKGVWRYRAFVVSSVAAELNNRVNRSRLGILWLVISPLVQVAIFALILSAIMRGRIPGIDNQFAYAIYLMAGFLPWYLFTEIVTRCSTMFIENANAMKKIVFPKVTLPVVIAAIAIINNLIFFLAVTLVYLALGHGLSLATLWLPLLILVNTGLATGLGVILGTLNVFIRDVGQMVPIFIQFGFWFTPIVYTANIIPEAYRGALYLNPIYWIVAVHRDVLVFKQAPDPLTLFCLVVLTLIVGALGMFMFKRASPEMVDVL